jgi:hypothetical protein
MQNKEKILVKGRIVKMNDAAFKIASRHFGARRNKPEEERPIELQKIPKLDIVSALTKVPKTELPVEVKVVAEPQAEVKEVVQEVKKVTRKRK